MTIVSHTLSEDPPLAWFFFRLLSFDHTTVIMLVYKPFLSRLSLKFYLNRAILLPTDNVTTIKHCSGVLLGMVMIIRW